MVTAPVFPLAQNDAFLVPSGTGNHIFFLMTDPAKNDEILLLNITTVRAGMPHDSSCYLDVGDHNFITHQSYVSYAHARRVLKSSFRSKIAAKEVVFRPPPLSAATFAMIAAGTASKQMTPEMKNFFDTYR